MQISPNKCLKNKFPTKNHPISSHHLQKMPLSSAHAFLLRPPSPPTTALSPLPVSSKIPNLLFHKKTHFALIPQTQTPNLKLSIPDTHRSIRCSVAVADPSSVPSTGTNQNRTSPAEVSRTIMELSSTGTLSTVTEEGWPLGIGARFVVDEQGIPALCLSSKEDNGLFFSVGSRSSFHVQLEQSGSRTPHCTFMGNISKPDDSLLVKKLETNWEKKFGEELDRNLLYMISVEQILHMGDFKERGIWVDSSDYISANPDPLRDFAEKIVADMNSKHSEDVQRLRNIYVDTTQLHQVMNTKMIWVDRLGFDLHIYTQGGEVFETRIPFPREVTDETAVKSSFNCMSHLAWEVEKTHVAPDFAKVELLKKIR